MTNGNPAYSQRPVVDASRLWAGGFATALVAALIAAVGVLIATGLFDAEVIAPGGFTETEAVNYAIAAAIAALLATALIQLLIAAVPRPFAYFNWITGLAVVVVTLLPFASSQELSTKVATALINLVTGVAIASLTSGTAARLARQAR
jgi:Family of unknown function (DUF6069)